MSKKLAGLLLGLCYQLGMVGVAESKNTSVINGTSAYLVTILIAIATIIVFIAAAPRFSNLSEHQIAPSDVVVLPHAGEGPFRRRRVNEVTYDLNSASQIPARTRRQYTYTFNSNEILTNQGATFIPHIGGYTEAYMNGVRIGTAQGLGSKTPGFASLFFLEDIPMTVYQTGVNRLTFVLTPDTSRAGLSVLYVGNAGDFSAAAARQIKRLDVLRKSQMIFGAAFAAFAIIGLLGRIRITPYAATFIVGIGLMALSFTAQSDLLWDTVILARLTALIYVITGLSLASLIKREFWREPPLILGFWLVAIISLIIAVLMLLPAARPFYAQKLIYLCGAGTIPFIFLFLSTCLMEDRRHNIASQIELSKKIAAQDAIILSQKAAIEEGLKAKGRLEERQRLTRDIHDGIGGQLLSLLVRVRDGGMSSAEIESDLQYGINDLRLIVDSMDHSEGTLETGLITFRARARAQLTAAGITLKWEQSNPFIETYFGPAAILNIFRLMQEAITNAIRHAQCDEIIVRISRPKKENDLVILIADNGTGFSPSIDVQAGQGLKNMQFRARALNGTLKMGVTSTGGAEVTLTVRADDKS